jgi:hypothetical protein
MERFYFQFTLLFFLSVGHPFAFAKGSRWQELMNLVQHETRVIESATKRSPELNYRLLSLYSEKLKLIHEKNNKEFLSASQLNKGGPSKDSFFTETRSLYEKTKAFGLKLLADRPTAFLRSEILLTMSLNSRDFGKDHITEGYLLEVMKLLKGKKHPVLHHAETAIAEYYYNEKRYELAVQYYEKVIQDEQDDWLAKHYLNLSWCYLKSKNFEAAILSINNAYKLSKNLSYVSVREQVLENIGPFYVYSGKPLEGLAFYVNNEKEPLDHLLNLAKKTSDKGHRSETLKILNTAQELVSAKKLINYQEDVFHAYLDYYRHYGLFAEFNETSNKLVNFYHSVKTKKSTDIKLLQETIEKLSSLASFLQTKVSKDIKEDGGSYNQKELNLILNLFNQLISIDPIRTADYQYFQGETHFAVRNFLLAGEVYSIALKTSKTTGQTQLRQKVLHSFLALTALEEIPKDKNREFLILAYNEHIEFLPKHETTLKIYPKLFEIYRELKLDLKGAEVLKKYETSFPQDLKSQQGLMTKLIDDLIDRKDTKKIAYWIHEFKKGFLAFPDSLIVQTEVTLGNMLFLEYQAFAKAGRKLEAAEGFESIYKNDLYTNKIKSLSAYFASLIQLELAQTDLAYDWQIKSFNIMSKEDRLNKREEMASIAERFYFLQDFKSSFKLGTFYLKEFCSIKDKIEDRFYEISIATAIVENNPKDAIDIVDDFSICTSDPKLKENALTQVFNSFEKKHDLKKMKSFVHKFPIEILKQRYALFLKNLFWDKNQSHLRENILQEIAWLNEPGTHAWLQGIKIFDAAVLESNKLTDFVFLRDGEFNSALFNQDLSRYLLQIQKFRSKYEHLLSSEIQEVSISSALVFVNLYTNVAKKIKAFHPSGMNSETLKDFQAAMTQVAAAFEKSAQDFKRKTTLLVNNKLLLSPTYKMFAGLQNIEHPSSSAVSGLIMDMSFKD